MRSSLSFHISNRPTRAFANTHASQPMNVVSALPSRGFGHVEVETPINGTTKTYGSGMNLFSPIRQSKFTQNMNGAFGFNSMIKREFSTQSERNDTEMEDSSVPESHRLAYKQLNNLLYERNYEQFDKEYEQTVAKLSTTPFFAALKVKQLIRTKRLDDVVPFLQKIDSSGSIQPIVIGITVKELKFLSPNKQRREALLDGIFKVIENNNLSFGSRATVDLMDLCTAFDKPDLSLKIFEDYKQRVGSVNAFLVASAVRACTASKKFPKTQELLEEASSSGLLSNSVIYVSVLEGYGASKYMKFLEHFFEDFKDKYPMNIPLLRAHIGVCARKGEVTQLRAHLAELESKGGKMTAEIKAAQILGYARGGYLDEAWAIFKELTSGPVRFPMSVYESGLDAAQRLGLAQVQEIVDHLRVRGISLSFGTKLKVISALVKLGAHKEALAYINEMPKTFPISASIGRAVIYNYKPPVSGDSKTLYDNLKTLLEAREEFTQADGEKIKQLLQF